MQIKIFTVPAADGEEQQEELNRFLRGNRVVSIDKQCCTMGDAVCWTFCIAFVAGSSPQDGKQPSVRKEKTDYKNLLSPEAFSVFSRLREIRKQLAGEDAVPAYAVFLDEELAQLAQQSKVDEQTMMLIEGINSKRMEKYGNELCRRYNEQQ